MNGGTSSAWWYREHDRRWLVCKQEGDHHGDKETWWWNDEVKEAIRAARKIMFPGHAKNKFCHCVGLAQMVTAFYGKWYFRGNVTIMIVCIPVKRSKTTQNELLWLTCLLPFDNNPHN